MITVLDEFSENLTGDRNVVIQPLLHGEEVVDELLVFLRAETRRANPQVPHAFTSEGDYVVACDICHKAASAAIHNP